MNATEQIKDPARKRSFNPADDVVPLLDNWARKNPSVIEARMINDALRGHLAEYRTKRSAGRKAA